MTPTTLRVCTVRRSLTARRISTVTPGSGDDCGAPDLSIAACRSATVLPEPASNSLATRASMLNTGRSQNGLVSE